MSHWLRLITENQGPSVSGFTTQPLAATQEARPHVLQGGILLKIKSGGRFGIR